MSEKAEILDALTDAPDDTHRDGVQARVQQLVNQTDRSTLTPKLKAMFERGASPKQYTVTFANNKAVTSQQGVTEAEAQEIQKLPCQQYFRVDPQDPLTAIKSQIAWQNHTLQIGSFEIFGHNPQPPKQPVLVIVGPAEGWQYDLEEVRRLGLNMEIMAVNSAGPFVKDARFWYSIHGTWLAAWEEYCQTGAQTICEFWVPGINTCYAFYNPELARVKHVGFSGNWAMLTGLIMGYHRVILCGCPLDNRPIDSQVESVDGIPLDVDTWKDRPHLPAIQLGFLFLAKKYPEVRTRVRSMSGYTRTILGSPTATWLTGEEQFREYQATTNRIIAELGIQTRADHPNHTAQKPVSS